MQDEARTERPGWFHQTQATIIAGCALRFNCMHMLTAVCKNTHRAKCQLKELTRGNLNRSVPRRPAISVLVDHVEAGKKPRIQV
jgi:hypothetical protein